MGYRTFFGFEREPFSPEIRIEDLYPLPGMQAASERFHFALKLGAVCLVTGDVGSGKSTALRYAASRPPASRIIGRSHLEGLKLKDMTVYLNHHLQIAGLKERLFTDEATLAIHQGSGGLLRRANLLAKGALTAAAREKCRSVSAEHVRIAATEIM